jgi:hypothetical protein
MSVGYTSSQFRSVTLFPRGISMDGIFSLKHDKDVVSCCHLDTWISQAWHLKCPVPVNSLSPPPPRPPKKIKIKIKIRNIKSKAKNPFFKIFQKIDDPKKNYINLLKLLLQRKPQSRTYGQNGYFLILNLFLRTYILWGN